MILFLLCLSMGGLLFGWGFVTGFAAAKEREP
jgi:hypothetical protein